MNDRGGQQLTVVSNRLPIVMNNSEAGWQIEAGSGGLVQAMNPILEQDGGRWVGWPGVMAEDGDGWQEALAEVQTGYQLDPVILSRDEYQGYYRGFANSVIWPLFHGFADRCQFNPEFYAAYGRVNEKFADTLVDGIDEDGFLWAHDYHLLELARRLREKGHRGKLAFFLHIPFPSLENFSKLPWGDELLGDLLHYDVLGFQTERDLVHFSRCVQRLGIDVEPGDGDHLRRFDLGGRIVEAGAFPIGIDYDGFAARAASSQVTERIDSLQADIGPYKVLLGVDRLDYSKGLLHRIRAYEKALERHPDLREEVVFFQLVVPSRESVPEYQALKREFDRIVGRINGRFSTSSWQPIHYLYNSVDPPELSALYRLASAALVTPLRDGMNLVSKEYCASQVDADGTLVLSEFAGSRGQLGDHAILVNPYDTDQTARAIYEAMTIDPNRRRKRMTAMRQTIEQSDVFWWAHSFLHRVEQQAEIRRHIVDTESVSKIGEKARSS